eukprot:scaffold12131_cov112-Isochrysis_galbana.AAC.14
MPARAPVGSRNAQHDASRVGCAAAENKTRVHTRAISFIPMATALLFASAAGVVLNGPAPRLVKQAFSPIIEGAWSQAAAVRASAAIAPMVLATSASAEFNFQVEMNRPPIELDPFTVTPFGWAVLAVYLTWFSWTILRPPSEEETKVWERRAEEAAEQAAGAAVFLKAASEDEGATQTASGLVIKQLMPGSGSAPTLDDTVVVHYTGKLSNGSIFDSSCVGIITC